MSVVNVRNRFKVRHISGSDLDHGNYQGYVGLAVM